MSELGKALVAAQQSAQAVGKTSVNAFLKYKYASAEALIEEGRAALTSAGLALQTTGWKITEDKSKIIVRYRLRHVAGESEDYETETSVIPDKGRPQDKAEATALTYALGYFLRGLLLLPRVEEGADVDARDDRPRNAPTQTRGRSAVDELLASAAKASDDDSRVKVFEQAIAAAITTRELVRIGQSIGGAKLAEVYAAVLRERWGARDAALSGKAAA